MANRLVTPLKLGVFAHPWKLRLAFCLTQVFLFLRLMPGCGTDPITLLPKAAEMAMGAGLV